MQRHERIQKFVTVIWKWYSMHKRSLPWRDVPDREPNQRAYKILVSEIMLQQTQVSRVIVTYRNFLERFPRIEDLAVASNKKVLIAWRGMGYNSRALRLRDAAKVISANSLTRLLDNSKSIPGVGPYTAAAIKNFAFGIPTPCIDTNIRRILHRTFVGPECSDGTWEKDGRFLLNIAHEVLREAMKSGTTQDWHAALMDFGSLVQTKRNPKWEICPLTAKNIMKTTKRSFELRVAGYGISKLETRNPKPHEPGRNVGSTFIPNRVFRGRVIEALRDAKGGLSFHDLGRNIAIDWDRQLHEAWLRTILQKLQEEKFLELRRGKYALCD